MSQTYTFASWNVNGLRAVLKKDPSFIQIAQELNVDILALQETKLQEGQVDIDLPGYHQTWSYAQRKGYSGTAVLTRQEPLRVLRADALLPYAGEGEAAELVAQAATEGAATQAFRTRSAASLPSCSTPVLPTPGERQIRTSRASTAGGATALMPARTTQAGASTTSW